MITVKIDVSGAVRKLRTAGAAFDQRRALSEIGDSVLKWTREGFATGGHGKWKRLAANTVADKGHSSPLIRSGKLAGSLKSRVFGNRVVIGTNDSKAPFHEYGTKRHVITARGRLLRFKLWMARSPRTVSITLGILLGRCCPMKARLESSRRMCSTRW